MQKLHLLHSSAEPDTSLFAHICFCTYCSATRFIRRQTLTIPIFPFLLASKQPHLTCLCIISFYFYFILKLCSITPEQWSSPGTKSTGDCYALPSHLVFISTKELCYESSALFRHQTPKFLPAPWGSSAPSVL